MIRVLIVDELPALKMADSVLCAFKDVNICGIFSDPEDFIDYIKTN